jgi:hypothetical protein
MAHVVVQSMAKANPARRNRSRTSQAGADQVLGGVLDVVLRMPAPAVGSVVAEAGTVVPARGMRRGRGVRCPATNKNPGGGHALTTTATRGEGTSAGVPTQISLGSSQRGEGYSDGQRCPACKLRRGHKEHAGRAQEHAHTSARARTSWSTPLPGSSPSRCPAHGRQRTRPPSLRCREHLTHASSQGSTHRQAHLATPAVARDDETTTQHWSVFPARCRNRSSTDRRTDGRADGRTDGWTGGRTERRPTPTITRCPPGTSR